MTAQNAPQSFLAWLENAITAREDIAQAAAALQDDPENGWGIVDDSDYAQPSERRYIAPHIGLTHEPQSAEHIVLHNPAAVLRRCAADRKLLESLKSVIEGDYIDDGEPVLAEHVLSILAEGYGWTADG